MDLTLPPARSIGDGSPADDMNLVTAALTALNNGKVESLSVGVVDSGPAGSEPVVSLTGGSGSYALNMTIPAGAAGATGETGSAGATGPAGPGVAGGGTTGKVLKKQSDVDHDTAWGTLTATDVGAVPTSRSITAGTGLTGGGNLTADRSLAVSYGTTAGTALEGTQLGNPKGLTGAVQATRYVGATLSGAPTTGTFAKGDVSISQGGNIYICTTAGTPGTWERVPSLTYILQQVASIENAPAGTVVNVSESGGTYTRPTARTDICVVFTGTSDPGSAALEGDKWDRV